MIGAAPSEAAPPPPARVWGLALTPWDRRQAVEFLGRRIDAGRPTLFITANTHYAMLSRDDPGLARVNARATFLVADGAPLVAASRWSGGPRLPGRVCGSDIIYDLAELAAARGVGLFLLGGGPGVAPAVAEALGRRAPGLRVVGVETPPFRELTSDEEAALLARIRGAGPGILMTAFTMPRGEAWLADRFEALGVPVCVNVGAAFDFVAGRVDRAPRWVQRLGLEWAHRISREPRRLAPRYARNARFVAAMLARDLRGAVAGRGPDEPRARGNPQAPRPADRAAPAAGLDLEAGASPPTAGLPTGPLDRAHS